METRTLTQADLDQFISTEQYYQHWMKQIKFTDGVKYMVEAGGAFWLIDVIASYRRKEPFQIWELKVKPDKSCVVTMREDTGQPTKVRQKILYTDFPLETIKLYLIDGVLLLPSEYQPGQPTPGRCLE